LNSQLLDLLRFKLAHSASSTLGVFGLNTLVHQRSSSQGTRFLPVITSGFPLRVLALQRLARCKS
jgi:hypothetical protein